MQAFQVLATTPAGLAVTEVATIAKLLIYLMRRSSPLALQAIGVRGAAILALEHKHDLAKAVKDLVRRARLAPIAVCFADRRVTFDTMSDTLAPRAFSKVEETDLEVREPGQIFPDSRRGRSRCSRTCSQVRVAGTVPN